eukprot:5814554-Pyramimonas_sp.AAC.1
MWRCKCMDATQHVLDRHGHDQQRAEYRQQVLVTLSKRPLETVANQSHKKTADTLYNTHTRVDRSAIRIVKLDDKGPKDWDLVTRRVARDLDKRRWRNT